MRDLLLQCSGLAAIVAALIHGVLGETKVFARATIEPRAASHPDAAGLAGRHGSLDRRRRAVDRRAMDGVGAGTALDHRDVRRRVRLRRAGNAWASRGRHFGWMVLSAVVALAVAGY